MHGNVIIMSDVRVECVMSVVSVLRGLFYCTIWFWKMRLTLLVLWVLWLLGVLWVLSGGEDPALNPSYFKISTVWDIRVMECFAFMKYYKRTARQCQHYEWWECWECYECCECSEGSVLLDNLILRNDSGIFSFMSVVTVRSFVSVIRGGRVLF